jgi:apolipoprotein N-acyltransferase
VSDRRRWLLVALGALALAGSYPPFPLPVLSFVAVAPAVLLLLDVAHDPRRAYRWGFRYGVAANGLVLYWMVVALWHFTALAALGYFVTVFLLGVFTGGLFWFVSRVRGAYPRVGLALVFPVAWTALEWAVGHLGDAAFPWLGLGTSLADAPVLVQWADLAGARGVTLWLAWGNVLVAEAVAAWGRPRAVARRLVPFVATVAVAWGYGLWRERSLPTHSVGTVALIQPDIGFDEKWDSARADSEFRLLLDLSGDAVRGAPAAVDLVVWPETAVPDYLPRRPDYDREIAAFVVAHRTPVLAGGLDLTLTGDGGYVPYNAAFFYDATGRTHGYEPYHKHYLVPVVERVPFVPVAWFRAVPWLGHWSGGFGRGTTLPVYPTAVGRLGVLVCYESAFEGLARGYRRAGADFLVNITNDAWFGRTAAPSQHASHLILRAIETRMGIARAANDGISEFVDPLGHVTQPSRLGTQAVVVGPLRTSDVRTLYVRVGDWVGTLSVVVTLGFAGGLVARRRTRNA